MASMGRRPKDTGQRRMEDLHPTDFFNLLLNPGDPTAWVELESLWAAVRDDWEATWRAEGEYAGMRPWAWWRARGYDRTPRDQVAELKRLAALEPWEHRRLSSWASL